MAAASKATPANAPMTIPAMAPPESFDLESEEVEGFDPEAALVEDGVDEAPADAREVEDPVVAALERVATLRVVELPAAVAELTILDRLPPRTCASRTTPTLDVQQSFAPPQHHRSLVAVPSQGTIAVLPNAFFVCWQTSRQPPADTSLLVQKSTHYDLLAC